MATWNLVNADDPLLARTAIAAADREICVNVKDYGATGDGVTDDTTAIELAWAAATAAPGTAEGNIFFPPGYYVYNGSGMAAHSIRMIGSGRKSQIILGASSYLIQSSALIGRLELRNIKTVGGLGAIKHTYTGNNVGELHIVENVQFLDYTECAVATDSADMPYWHFINCQYDGDNTTDTIGVALGGNPANCVFDNCSFIKNRIHIKARDSGSNISILNTDFIQWSTVNSGGPRVSVWLVPGTSNTDGMGFNMRGCKFGNENIAAGDIRVLYADELAGASNGVQMPDLTADSTGYIAGHRITACNISHGTAGECSFIYSTTPNVNAIAVGDCFVHSSWKYLLEYRTPPATPHKLDSTNRFGPFTGWNPVEGNLLPISNGTGVGDVVDPAGLLAEPGTVRVGAGAPAGFEELTSTAIGSFNASSVTKDSDDTDAMGGTEAATFTFNHASTAQINSGPISAMSPGKPVWVEFDLANPDDGNELDQLFVYVQDTSSSFHWRRTVVMPTVAQGWVNYAFSFVPRTAGTSTRLYFSNADSGELKSATIGRARVYHGSERQIGGSRPAVTGTSSLVTALKGSGIVAGTAPPAPVSDPTNFASIPAGSYEDLTITVTGAVEGDCVALGVPNASMTPGVIYSAWVSAADTVTVRAENTTGGSLNPTGGSFNVAIVR